MNTKFLFVLLLLPGLAHAVVCKTVGEDGVASFTDVPAAECPQGSRIPEYSRPEPVVERAGSVNTGVSARQVAFAGYESIEIDRPEDGGTVRSNEGRVPVIVQLDPGLQQSHFITAYLDGRATRGRYGSSQIELTGVDPGTHKLQAIVSDSKGKTLIESETVSFTLLRMQPIRVLQVAPNPSNVDEYIISGQFLGGPVAQPDSAGAEVTIHFPDSDEKYKGKVDKNLNWVVEVGSEPAIEKRFDVAVKVLDLEFKKTQDINPSISRPVYTPPPSSGYLPSPATDYRAKGGGISTTPGQTNPAFTPKYTP
ncbi:MAG: DUF4124 domain-containing protein [Sedimenticolaceae bacterium]